MKEGPEGANNIVGALHARQTIYRSCAGGHIHCRD